MGVVLPWILGSLADNHTVNRRMLYAINTIGGLFGALVTGFLLLPMLGTTQTALVATMTSGFVTMLALVTGKLLPSPVIKTDAEPSIESQELASLGSRWHRVASAVSGFAIVALEVQFQRQIAQVAINSFFSSTAILSTVLVALAFGAFLSARVTMLQRKRSLSWLLAAAAVVTALQPACFLLQRGGTLETLRFELPPLAYAAEMAGLATVAILPALVIGGLLFPLVLTARKEPEAVGQLLADNGIGGLCGALVGTFLFPKLFGLWSGVPVTGLLYAGLAALRPGGRLPAAIGTAVCCVTAVLWLGLPQLEVRKTDRVHGISFSAEGVVATVEPAPGDVRMVFNNTYTLGGTKARMNQERQALLPILLHGSAHHVALLGVATGGTLGGSLVSTHVRKIDAVELIPEVMDHGRRFFAPHTRGAFENPRVHLAIADARLWMRNHSMTRPGTLDVVVGELFLPWRTGEGRLYSKEHFEAVHASLAKGGIFCQWLPLFQLTEPQVQVIIATFSRVFPDGFLVRGDFYGELPILGLVGGRSMSTLDWAQITDRCAELRVSKFTTDDPLMRHAEGVAMLLIGPFPEVASRVPSNTLTNGWIEWDAGRNIVGMAKPWFVRVPWAEFSKRAHRAGIAYIPESLRHAHDAGQFFLTLEIARLFDAPQRDALEERLQDFLPATLRLDDGADWTQWPMRGGLSPIR
jgi:hypothetical protein